MLRFLGVVGEFRNGRLHLEGHLVLRDAGGDFWVVLLGVELPVQIVHLVDHLALGRLTDAVGVADVVHGIAFGLELDALEFAGEEAGTPLAGRDRLGTGTLREQYDVAGEVLGFRAESVEQP